VKPVLYSAFENVQDLLPRRKKKFNTCLFFVVENFAMELLDFIHVFIEDAVQLVDEALHESP
jgi:hypothetical protein